MSNDDLLREAQIHPLESRLLELGREALPVSEEDWGSDRQVEAENRYFDLLRALYPDRFGEGSEFEAWSMKASTMEMVEESWSVLVNAGALSLRAVSLTPCQPPEASSSPSPQP